MEEQQRQVAEVIFIEDRERAMISTNTGFHETVGRRSRSKSRPIGKPELYIRRQKEQRQQKKVFAQLAGIYLQNPYYLRSSQLAELLRLKTASKNSHIELQPGAVLEENGPVKQKSRYCQLEERPPSGFTVGRRDREIDRRRLESNFRISSKKHHKPLLLFNAKLGNSMSFAEPTLEVEGFGSVSPSHRQEQSPPRPIKTRNVTNSIAEGRMAATSDHFFRRSRATNSVMDPQSTKTFIVTDKDTHNPSEVDRRSTCKSANKMSNSTISKTFSFVLNSKDVHIRRQLERQGWFENKVLSSPIYNLKWCYKEEVEDYKLIEGGRERYYNHIKNNEMTNKSGLNRLFKQLCESGCRPSRFIPRTYEISEEDDLAMDYEDTSLQIIIKNHVEYFQYKRPRECELIRSLIVRKKRKHIDEELLTQFIKISGKADFRDQAFVVNLPTLTETFVLIECRTALAEGRQLDRQFAHVFEDPKLLKTVLRFSKIRPPYEDYFKITRSNIEEEFSAEKLRQGKINNRLASANKSSSWWTPSIPVMYRTFLYDGYFRQTRPAYRSDGLNNIWIIKPSNCSRGQGIFLTDKLQTILENKQRNKIVQKYIEQVWVLTEQRISQAGLDGGLRNSRLFQRKFDLRQWVLLQSVNPLVVHIFSEFYVKICPERYSCGELHNLSKHLSNYSINKTSFKDPHESIMNQQEFAELLASLGIDLAPIKQRIKNVIADIIRVGSESMEHIDGCFELLGFDIILDEQLNPWVLQVNMSPACSERTEWLSDMLTQMTRKMFLLVLPPSMFFNSSRELVNDRYNWQPIINEEKFEHRNNPLPELIPTRLNLAKERRLQRYFKPQTENKVIAVQRCIREYLRRLNQN